MKMDALKAAFSEMGFTNTQTVLASGNVIFYLSEEDPREQELKAYIESGLGKYFLYDAHVFIRGDKELQDMLAAAQTVPVPEGCHHYILICDEREVLMNLRLLFDSMPHEPDEQLILHSCGAFWIVPKGSTLDSEFGSKVLGSRQYKSLLTSRNMNTIQKILRAMINK
jgi:uncharacterized protein (DUF1697 family)